jgi:hypothetical protein
MENKKVELFLDSGAFSAWSQGKEINIDEYIQFIKENEDAIDVYANLDSIGDPIKTWDNQMYMESKGLHPLPVYHYGEDIKWLLRMLKKGYDYIALGGMVPISNDQLIHWLDDLFSKYLTDENGMPIIKVHGFGLTSLPLMLRYPWYSVDSTSWVITGRMGAIYIPKFKNGKWIYDENSWKINVSNRSPNIKDSGKHISTMSPMEKDILMKYIAEKGYKLGHSDFEWVPQDHELKENEKWVGGKDLIVGDKRELEIMTDLGVSNRYQMRDEMNIMYFLDLEKSMPEWPWAFIKKEESAGMF